MILFVIVIAVLVVLNAFFVLIIRTLSGRVGKFAQNNMLRQSSVFDELILKKEETYKELCDNVAEAEARLEAIEGKRESHADRPAVEADYFAVNKGEYKDPAFAEEYREIRENFVFDQGEKLREVLQILPGGPESDMTKAARRILSETDADTVYQLSTMSSDDQRHILKEVFDETQMDLLAEYDEQREPNQPFESYKFFEWLKIYIFENGREVKVRTAGAAAPVGAPPDIDIARDDTLCEGMYVISQGRMYDYSVRNKEISG
jgi:hypothetical protein